MGTFQSEPVMGSIHMTLEIKTFEMKKSSDRITLLADEKNIFPRAVLNNSKSDTANGREYIFMKYHD